MPQPSIRKDNEFLRPLLRIALPVAAAHIFTNAVGLADMFMVGALGDAAVAAVSAANRFLFIFELLEFGVVSGGTVLAAQYYGKRDLAAVSRIAAIVLRITVTAGLAFGAAALLIPQPILRIFSGDPEVIKIGVGYLRIVAVTYVTMGVSAAYANFLRAIEKTSLNLAVQVMAFFLNTTLNAVFIFGLFGAPRLGVNGAALGTLLSRLAELLVVLVYAVRFRHTLPIRPRDLFRLDRALLGDFLRHSGAVVLNEVLWGVGDSLHLAVLGHISTVALASASVALSIQSVLNVGIIGLASASAVSVGQRIGRGEFAAAKRECKLYLIVAALVGFFCAGLQLSARAFFVGAAVGWGIFRLTPAAVALTKQMMLLLGLLLPFNSLNCIIVVGVLRAGGDTKAAAFLDVGFMWLLSLPAGAIAAFALGWPPMPVLFLLYVEEILKFSFSLARLCRWKWMKNLTRQSAKI
ncbi:MAG: MATE family efflux transporter [Oscillospiraceae bacterium]|jgi:putative MATE family efflux protein|nr:MATE family efflux transporter [Oscillospiraceae bacterium]